MLSHVWSRLHNRDEELYLRTTFWYPTPLSAALCVPTALSVTVMFDAEKGVYFISIETLESTKGGGGGNTKRALSHPTPPLCRPES